MDEKTFFDEKWKAIEKIGEGSFGVVYKAVKKQYGIESYSAIKQIMIPHEEREYSRMKSEGFTESDIDKSYDDLVGKWIEEIEFLNQFKDNQNIVSIEDFEVLKRKDKNGRIINIRMELLNNIDDYVLNKTITDKDVLKMALDILNALDDCEEKKVVHRDIKPDNIFINSRGIYKLGDFGVAKNIEKTVSDMSKRGTDNYMAPELYKGEKGSKSVDTYSLGIMLYKYFNNNRLPYLPDYPNEIRYQDRENAIENRMNGKELKPPAKASNNIAKIILKACSYRPEDRYTCALEFRKDIEKEYIQITNPMNLFDFQNNEEIEVSYDKTSNIFSNASNIKTSYDKTVYLFEREKSESNNKKINDENIINEKTEEIKENQEVKNKVEEVRSFEKNIETKQETKDNQKSDFQSSELKKSSVQNKKSLITIGILGIFLIIVLILIIIPKNSGKDKSNINVSENNPEQDVYRELNVSEGMKKAVKENLSIAIPNEFELYQEDYYTYTNKKGTINETFNRIDISARNINSLREECHKADTYLEFYKTELNYNESSVYSDVKSVDINGQTWLKMRETKKKEKSISIYDYYVIVYDEKLYEVRIICTNNNNNQESVIDMSIFDDTINSLTLNKINSDNRNIENLKIKIPTDLKFNDLFWYRRPTEYRDGLSFDYSVDISIYGKNRSRTIEEQIKYYQERAQKENATVSEVATEQINGNTWTKLEKIKKIEGEYSINYYYLINNEENIYIVDFSASARGKGATEELDTQYFENMVNSIKNSLQF